MRSPENNGGVRTHHNLIFTATCAGVTTLDKYTPGSTQAKQAAGEGSLLLISTTQGKRITLNAGRTGVYHVSTSTRDEHSVKKVSPTELHRKRRGEVNCKLDA